MIVVDATNSILFCLVCVGSANNLLWGSFESSIKTEDALFYLIIIKGWMFEWQLKGWYNKDDVVAQWTEMNGEVCLDVHCYVSGPNPLLDLAAELRYHIFSKELPLVSPMYDV